MTSARKVLSKAERVDRRVIAGMLMQLFDHWGLSAEEQLDLLGLSATNRAALTRYRRGEPLSASRDTMERAGYLLGIHKNLRVLFPHQRELAYAWMKTPNRAFERKTPTQVIRDYGFAGLLMVRAYLDRALGPDTGASMAADRMLQIMAETLPIEGVEVTALIEQRRA